MIFSTYKLTQIQPKTDDPGVAISTIGQDTQEISRDLQSDRFPSLSISFNEQ